MVKEEWKNIVINLKSAYTSPNFLPDETSWRVWLYALADLPAEVVGASAVVYIQQNHFPPTIADLREIASRFMEDGDEQNEIEAWTCVSKAIRNSTYHAEESFEKLPPLIQKAVGSPAVLKEWAMSDYDSIQVTQSNFMRNYRVVSTREKEAKRLSPQIRETLGISVAEPIKIETKKPTETEQREDCFVSAPEDLIANLRRTLGAL